MTDKDDRAIKRGETEAVWQQMPGAQPLYDRYGYWPTLHDAIIREMIVSFSGRELVLVLDYNNMTLGDDPAESLRTRIHMRWAGISESRLRIEDHDLYGVAFRRMKDLIETRFTDYAWGTDGFIRSSSIEVIEIVLDPNENSEPPAHSTNRAIRLKME